MIPVAGQYGGAMKNLSRRTTARFQMVDITDDVRKAVRESRVSSGLCSVFVPHTTAAVTINENADPDVPRDILTALDRVIPLHDNYRHIEGNAAAHIKASLVGASEQIFIEKGELVLGTWQSVFFCEFDGPRTRRILIKVHPTP